MKKYLLILVIALSTFQLLHSAGEKNADLLNTPKNRIGVSASMISGWGLSYQHIFDPLAIKFTGFYYYQKMSDSYYSYETQYDSLDPYTTDALGSVGLEIKYYIFKSKYVNLYPFIGFSYWINKNETPQTYYDNKPPYDNYKYYTRKDNSDTYNVGAGVGLELMAGKYFSFNFDVGLKYLNGTTIRDTYDNPPKTENLQDLYFGLAVGGGISFAF